MKEPGRYQEEFPTPPNWVQKKFAKFSKKGEQNAPLSRLYK